MWSNSNRWTVEPQIPFVVDVSEKSLHNLDTLLSVVWDGLETSPDRPPTQDKECVAVAGLNLLKLQVSNT
jgi:E3 ubiquitin-protein ligase HERC2